MRADLAARFPHPLTLLVGGVFLAAALSWVLPAGEFARRTDPATGREVVVAGTYHRVPPSPVGPGEALVAIPRGMQEAGSVIFLVFLVGGAFVVVDRTGAFGSAVDWLAGRLQDRTVLVIPALSALFALGGVLVNMQEEFIALIPVLLVLTRRLGYDALTAVAMSLGAAAVGSAFSPLNPFQVGIAQKLAGLPLLSGWRFRVAFLVPALGIWVWGTMRYALRTQAPPAAGARVAGGRFPPRHGAVLLLVLLAFAVYVWGLLRLGWEFDQMSALFFALGMVAGLVGGLGVGGTVEAYVQGFRELAFAALLIGFARAIFVVLDAGHVIDTLVQGLVTPILGLPLALSALGMAAVQALIHIPVPSVSGQAVLTLPVLVPASDLLGLGRQVTVLAYQVGAGLMELLTPTNGALMAILAAAGVRYDRWLRFAVPLYLLLVALGGAAILAGIAWGVG